jgi:hypothetical protein
VPLTAWPALLRRAGPRAGNGIGVSLGPPAKAARDVGYSDPRSRGDVGPYIDSSDWTEVESSSADGGGDTSDTGTATGGETTEAGTSESGPGDSSATESETLTEGEAGEQGDDGRRPELDGEFWLYERRGSFGYMSAAW